MKTDQSALVGGQSIVARRALLAAARAAGPHSAAVQQFIDFYSDTLAMDESDGRLTWWPDAAPDIDLDAAIDGGPAIAALVANMREFWAMHEAA